VTYEKAVKAVDAAKLDVTTEGAKPFKFYKNLLTKKLGSRGKRPSRPK